MKVFHETAVTWQRFIKVSRLVCILFVSVVENQRVASIRSKRMDRDRGRFGHDVISLIHQPGLSISLRKLPSIKMPAMDPL